MYPKMKYTPDPETGFIGRIIHTPEQEEALGEDWYDSPADFGIETHPGAEQDALIAANRQKPEVNGKKRR